MKRIILLLALGIGAGGARGDELVLTPNFAVEAPTHRLAMQVAYEAEAARVRFAAAFLGREARDWPTRVPLTVRLTWPGQTTNGWSRNLSQHLHWIEIADADEMKVLATVSHEVAHIMMGHELDGNLGHRWFAEGLAVYFETLDEGYPSRLEERICGLRLDDLLPSYGIPYYVHGDAFYGQAYSVVRYVADRFGHDQLWAFYRRGCRDGWDLACLMELGTTMDQLERDWRASLKAWESPYPRTLRGKGL